MSVAGASAGLQVVHTSRFDSLYGAWHSGMAHGIMCHLDLPREQRCADRSVEGETGRHFPDSREPSDK